MSELNLTQEQAQAVFQKGKIIVSASAGSGKTFVMIRRLINAILSGLDMQEFLAVTFTKKAADSMLEKLRSALIDEINKEQDEKKKSELKRKLSEVALADISTIHSFCSHLIRRYFYEIEIGDDFSVCGKEDADGKRLYDETLKDVISSAYEDPDEDFLLLVKVFRSRDGYSALSQAISTVYDKLRTDLDYRNILEVGGRYTQESFGTACSFLLNEWKHTAKRYRKELTEMEKSLTLAPFDCMAVYEAIDQALKLVEEANDIFALVNACLPAMPRKGTSKKGYTEDQLFLRDEINALKTRVSDFIKKEIFECGLLDEETEKERYLQAGSVLKALYAYVLKFDDLYSERKKKRLKLDYNDLERYAFKLLQKEEVLLDIKAKYKMIFVDEYQDVNPLQEKIISALSEKEVFLVGDKKQAIYSFRGGKSKYFTQKEEQKDFIPLQLSTNFRSSRQILQFVNEVFIPLMNGENSDIDYSLAPMRGGDRYGERDGFVKIHVVEKQESESEEINGLYRIEDYGEKAIDFSSAEGEKVLSIIRASVSDPTADNLSSNWEKDAYYNYYDVDEKVEEKRVKRVSYGDIAILVRSDDEKTKKLISYLVDQGIPVTSLSQINVCDYPEIQQLIGILQTLDNAESDIPLCVSLLSPVGGLSEKDLADIRIYGSEKGEEYKNLPFRRLCEEYSVEKSDALAEKINEFYRRMAKLKKKTYLYSATEVVGELLSVYGLESHFLSYPNGKNRMARVERFLAECGTDGVHEFLKKLKTMGHNVPFTENNGENSVKVLTIHKSKGLEYPVVILPFLNKGFHTERGELLYGDAFGFLTNSYDFSQMKKYKTILRRAGERYLKREEVKDELNVFYVALTRAKYAMHLVLSSDGKRKFEYSSFADCISQQTIERYRADIPNIKTERSLREYVPLVGCVNELSMLGEVYQKEYAFMGSEDIAVKSSATSLMKELQAEEYYPTYHPFAEKGETKTSTAIGTAYHAFLEQADFSKVQGEYERLASVLPADEYSLLDRQKCERILSLPTIKQLQNDTLYKEQKFIVSFPANRFDASVLSDDPILYQGAIDLLAIGKNGVTIVDYKYSVKSADELKRHYLPQIRLYRDTVARLMKISPSTIRTVILNIFKEEEIIVEL